MTCGSRPLSGRRRGSQYGFGSDRASNTKSASPGIPCLNPNDSNVIESRSGARHADPLGDHIAKRMHAQVRGIDEQIRRMGNRLEQVALERQRRAQIETAAAHGVRTPCFGEAPQQHLVGRGEENQLAIDTAAAQLVDQPRHGGDLRGRVARIDPTAARPYVSAGLRTAWAMKGVSSAAGMLSMQ